MTSVQSAPWFVYPPAVDLANTVGPAAGDGSAPVPAGAAPAHDALADDAALDAFVAVERGRFPHVDAVVEHREATREVRSTVRRLLDARIAGAPLPADAVAAVNEWSAAAPTHPVLTPDGMVHVDGAGSAWDGFRAAVARSAIELVSGDDLRRCGAPACGMFYVRTHPRQTWCSAACGNRARVARHAARSRAASG